MKKLLLFLTLIFLFTGCSQTPEQKQAVDSFIAKYGAMDVFICNEAGFLENRFIYKNGEERRMLQKNDANQPVRCNVENTSIQVKETVATGALSGNVN